MKRLVLLLFVAFPAVAHAERANQIQFDCGKPNFQNVRIDPLASYGVSPTEHGHTQGGANVFTATETIPDMLAATATGCPLSTDRTSFWFPTPLKPDGTPATVTDVQYWLANAVALGVGQNVGMFTPGLRFISGDKTCTSQFGCDAAEYICKGVSPERVFKTIPTEAQCGTTNGFVQVIYATNQQCWDGASLGQGFGTSGSKNAIGTNIVSADPCPAGNSHVIPGTAVAAFVGADGYGGCLSSDLVANGVASCSQVPARGASLHNDWVEGMTVADQQKIDASCLDPQFGVNTNVLTACLYRKSGPQGPGLYATNGTPGQFPTFVTAQ